MSTSGPFMRSSLCTGCAVSDYRVSRGSQLLDGQRGFCFGAADVERWATLSEEAIAEIPLSSLSLATTPMQKRKKFFQDMDWAGLHQLVVDAEILQSRPDTSAVVNVERAAAMLALTAIHDVMKVEAVRARDSKSRALRSHPAAAVAAPAATLQPA
jgi:hypothetical protein